MTQGTARFLLLTTMLAGVLLVLMVVVIAYVVTVDERAGAEVAPEIVRSAIGVILVGILGSMITFVIRQHVAIQEEARRLDEYRIRQLLDIVGAYNEAKGVRRALRAAGFTQPGPQSFAPWQVDEFRRQMAVLSAAELAMEKTKRELRENLGGITRLDDVREALRDVEGYLQTIITEWEETAVRVAAGPIDVRTVMPQLTGFLAGDEEDPTTFRRCVSSRMRFIQDCIRLDIAKRERAARRPPPEPEPLEPEPLRQAAVRP